MTAYNVSVPVVELIDAATPEAAIETLRSRLMLAGFDPCEFDADAFESETQ